MTKLSGIKYEDMTIYGNKYQPAEFTQSATQQNKLFKTAPHSSASAAKTTTADNASKANAKLVSYKKYTPEQVDQAIKNELQDRSYSYEIYPDMGAMTNVQFGEFKAILEELYNSLNRNNTTNLKKVRQVINFWYDMAVTFNKRHNKIKEYLCKVIPTLINQQDAQEVCGPNRKLLTMQEIAPLHNPGECFIYQSSKCIVQSCATYKFSDCEIANNDSCTKYKINEGVFSIIKINLSRRSGGTETIIKISEDETRQVIYLDNNSGEIRIQLMQPEDLDRLMNIR